MRLLILSSEFPPSPGGIGTHASQLAKQFIRLGAKVLVITSQDYADQDDIMKFNQEQPYSIKNLKSLPFPIFEAIYRMYIVKKEIRSWCPNIILASGSRSTWVMAVLARSREHPWIAIGHGSEFGGKMNLEKKMTRWAFDQADSVICVSKYTSQLLHRLKITPRKEIVINNGADDDFFSPDTTGASRSILKSIGLNDETLCLLTVGNITRRKGQEVVIRALPKILRKLPLAHYLLVGMPTEKARLLKIAIDLDVQEHVHFLGKLDPGDLPKLYQASDLFVMTSRKLPDGDFEGFGISVIEAALCGKPAVVSKGCGLEEAVVDGFSGLTVPENDPESTAEAINQLLEDSEKRLWMGENALQRARQGYTWKIIGQKYFDHFQELIKAREEKE